MASADVAGLVKRNGGIEPIIRGAAYSRTQKVDASFVAEISSSSSLFNLPVETVQRGRDHGECIPQLIAGVKCAGNSGCSEIDAATLSSKSRRWGCSTPLSNMVINGLFIKWQYVL